MRGSETPGADVGGTWVGEGGEGFTGVRSSGPGESRERKQETNRSKSTAQMCRNCGRTNRLYPVSFSNDRSIIGGSGAG